MLIYQRYGMKQKNFNVLLGPTSTGKTSLAIELCQKLDGEIISADSRQVVKFMNIGTGKIPVNLSAQIHVEQDKYLFNGIPTWGYDLVNPNEYFSAFDFAKFAVAKIHEIKSRNRKVFLVGGTGFYIDPIIGRASFSDAPPDLALRNKLEGLSLDELISMLDGQPVVDLKNKVRVVRALEIQQSEKANTNKLEVFEPDNIIGLTGERSLLYKRADDWVDSIWDNGLIQEVVALKEGSYGTSWRLNGLIYGTALDFLGGKLTETDSKQRMKFDVHAYIRRQQTWFKRNTDIKWFDISETDYRQKILDLVE